MRGYLVIVVVFLCILCNVHGFATGAPPIACASLTPSHGYQQSRGLYSLYTDATSFSPGNTVTVTVAGYSFAGLMMQARAEGSTTPVGTWSTTVYNTQTIRCLSPNDTITHSSPINKPSGSSFIWTAPQDDNPGSVKFHLTVARTKRDWWKDLTTSTLTSYGYARDVSGKAHKNGATESFVVCFVIVAVVLKN